METILAVVIGGMYGMGLYMLMRRSIVKLIIGLALLSNAVNLLIFTTAGLTRGKIPIIAGDANRATLPVADPMPQSLILTAIVIGFAVLAFTAVLLKKAYGIVGTDDLDQMQSTDR